MPAGNALTLHNAVKWQRGRQIKVQLQSKQSISLFFPISSHSATVRPVKLGLPTVEWEKTASWIRCYLMIALVSVYASTDVPLWYIETDHLISALFYFSPIQRRIVWSQRSEREIYYYSVHSQYDTGWETARMAVTNEIRRGVSREYIWDHVLLLPSDTETKPLLVFYSIDLSLWW